MPDTPSCPQSSPRSGWSWCGNGTSPAGGRWLPSAQPGHLHSELVAKKTHQAPENHLFTLGSLGVVGSLSHALPPGEQDKGP